MPKKFIIVETTYPNLASAKKLGKLLLEKKLAACVQFLPIKSMYFWQGKIENSSEILVLIKSENSLYNEIEKTIKEHHTYEIPQILCSLINQGSMAYLKWIESKLENRK
jgi:periplasmic divalent cation tolerance protein